MESSSLMDANDKNQQARRSFGDQWERRAPRKNGRASIGLNGWGGDAL